MYSSKIIAKAFLELAFQESIAVTPMKLQKLVYFAHGWNLALNNEPLISDVVEAWQYGPVIRPVYFEYRKYRNENLTSLGKDTQVLPTLDSKAKEIVEETWETYKNYSALTLSVITHEEGSPWDQVVDSCGWEDKPKISNELIKEFFENTTKNASIEN